MTTAATEVIGPVVSMCDNPACGGWDACDRIRRDEPMGVIKEIDPAVWPGDEAVCVSLREDLALNYATDSHGLRRMIPDGCEFTVHKGPGPAGKLHYTAIYSGPARNADEAVAGMPEYDWDSAHDRFKRMRQAGRSLSCLLRVQQQPAQGKSSHARRLIRPARESTTCMKAR